MTNFNSFTTPREKCFLEEKLENTEDELEVGEEEDPEDGKFDVEDDNDLVVGDWTRCGQVYEIETRTLTHFAPNMKSTGKSFQDENTKMGLTDRDVSIKLVA